MRLVLQLVVRLFVIVILCLGAATVWATIDAHHSVDRATAASAERVSVALGALYWRESLLRSNRMREQLLPVAHLNGLLKLATKGNGAEHFVVVMQVGSRRFGVAVDQVLHTEEIVVKPLSAMLRGLTLFSGNTILGDGSVIMILDPNGVAGAIGVNSDVSVPQETAVEQAQVEVADAQIAAEPAGPGRPREHGHRCGRGCLRAAGRSEGR